MTADETTRRARALVMTSVEDCKTSLHFEANPDVVREALRVAEEFGQSTRVKLLRGKIKREGW